MDAFASGPAADFDHPLEMLSACHDRIRRQCATLLRLAAHLATRGADDEAREAARNVLRYFETAAPNHHRDEEDDLFPALLARAPEADGVVATLQAEHRTLEALWADMEGRLHRVEAGGDGGLTTTVAGRFAGAYDRHIALEESELLPLARRRLEPAAIAQLGESMARRRGARPPA